MNLVLIIVVLAIFIAFIVLVIGILISTIKRFKVQNKTILPDVLGETTDLPSLDEIEASEEEVKKASLFSQVKDDDADDEISKMFKKSFFTNK